MAQAEQGTAESSKPSKADEAMAKAKVFGGKLKGYAKKAVDSTKEFVKQTEEEIKMTESMEGLLTMAITEFQSYIKQKADLTDKNKTTKDIADSFNNSVGIVFVASFNVAFTVGGSYGRGIVMKRLGDGNWSKPLAIQEIEGSVGWQLNVSRTKTFYVLKNEMAVKNLQQKQNVKLGGKGFAAIGNIGVQAQGDVTASKESLTTTTNDAKDVAATNASVGSVKGVAFGVNVNAGTFQSCKKINDNTYNNFDIATLFDKGINDAEGSGNNNNGQASGPSDDAKEEDKKNTLKDEKLNELLQQFIKLMEGVIQMEKEQKKDESKSNDDNTATAATSGSAPSSDK